MISKIRRLLSVVGGIGFIIVRLAAQPYGNEWIDYAKTYYKIKVARNGIYRIPASTLVNAGINVSTIAGGSFVLYHYGEPVPIYVSTTGFFGQNDFIEFYGQRNDGRLDTRLYTQPDYQPNPYFSLFNDTSIYYLTWNVSSPGKFFNNIPNDLTNLPPRENSCTVVDLQQFTGIFFPGRPISLGGNPPQYGYRALFDEAEGFIDVNIPIYNSKTIEFSTPGIVASGPATLKTVIVSTSNTTHRLVLKFNNITLKDTSFSGFCMHRNVFNINPSSLTALNNFEVTSAGGTSSVDNNAIAYAELTYQKNFDFNNRTRYKFAISGSTGPKYIEIINYNDESTDPILYDFTNQLRIVGTQGSNPHRFKLPGVSTATNLRELFITSQSTSNIVTITTLEPVNFINYGIFPMEANFIIISHPSLFNDGTGTDWVGEYAKYRQTLAGGSWITRIVNIEELYEQFAYGVRKHPLAIRNFIKFVSTVWTQKPQHLFLIGKGRSYDEIRYNSGAYQQCLVPTFGNKGTRFGGSDNLLTATTTSITASVSTGRLSASSGNDVRIYLQKIKEFDDQQNKKGDPYQTVANKLWMKEVLHMGGGNNLSEQQQFAFYLNSYKQELTCDSFGGNVTSFFKTSSDPIQLGISNTIRNAINNGVTLITFFGHSTTNSFDISVDNPNDFTNYKKYPVILSNGCFTGNIFDAGRGISEQFVFAENKAAIAFLSTTSLSSSTGLNQYSSRFYKNFTKPLYHKSIGEVMIRTTQELEQATNNEVVLMIAEEMVLHGDPSIKLNTHEKPDWCLEPQMISFIPSTVNVEDATFTMRVIVPNLGKSLSRTDSIILAVDRVFPSGSSVRYTKRIAAPCYVDTIDMIIETGAAAAFGLNHFCLKIEDEDRIDEISETNNELCITLNILSDDIFPIYPYEFAIINKQNITLAASTANSFAPVRTYLIEIDTTELFNSPLKQSATFTMPGGLLKWVPPITFIDSMVYYWRVGTQGTGRFNYSSFVYLPNDSPGWNQSHYYQFKKDEYNNILFDDSTNRLFQFVGDLKEVRVYTGEWRVSIGGDGQDISYQLNGAIRQRWNCGGNGFYSGLTVAVFDPLTGEPWSSKYPSETGIDPCSGHQINLIHKSIHCKPRDTESFMFPVGTNNSCNWEQRLVDFLQSIPNGHYILIYSVNCANYSSFPPALLNALIALGSVEITNLTAVSGCTPWAFFVKKGTPSSVVEKRGNLGQVLEFTTTFSASWYEGQVSSPLIGPAFQWKHVYWAPYQLENPSSDVYSLEIIGVKQDRTEQVLVTNITTPYYEISGIDAQVYPWVRLRMKTRDNTDRTPTQLNSHNYRSYWKVVHDIVPEAALAPNLYFEFTDQVNLGENMQLKVAIENVSPVHMDSLLVKYTIHASGFPTTISYARYDSLRAGQQYNLDFRFNTNCNCLADLNTLIIEANPDNDQREQFHFNNIGILNFKVQGDNQNPLLDVTFDGVHIMNGDIVSAEPEILIRLRDENKYLALDDTALIKVFIKYPDGTIQPQYYSSGYMTFIPATPSQLGKRNVAEIYLRKKFEQDGIYELMIQAQDRSRNISGTYGDPLVGIDYRISFEVINKEMITQVLNYPNPFSTSTRFVFTLTGSELPTYMKIQIMNVSGKVVREIELDELGPIRIGRNITEFAWDGTDQYGDRLANGIYFYRVVASLHGKPLEKLESKADKYFKSGLGKMYLIK